ncbi:hypothetical protein MKEN_00976800 [Mycena kentingensis (nom. inval.)]|nr:hypothetical protein MKEN_00976800 [Mycena kentingensis (nom. inval.)]
MSRRVIVDDVDSAIKYSSTSWSSADVSQLNKGNYGPVWQGTTHSTATDGSTLSFDFDGTYVSVMGTIAVTKLADGTYDPTWECTVDGVAIANPAPTFEFIENNWTLCEGKDIAAGKHTLSIKVHTKGTAFYLDNLIYQTSGTATNMDGAMLLYPASDSLVTYASEWHDWGAQKVTQTKGAQVSFSFRGTEVSMTAYVPTELAHAATTASYTIDGGPATSIRLAGLSDDNTLYNAVILSLKGLSADQHKLVITYQGSGDFTPLPVGTFFVKNSLAPKDSAGGGSTGTGASGGSTDSGPGSGTTVSAASGSVSISPSGSSSGVGAATSLPAGGSSSNSNSDSNPASGSAGPDTSSSTAGLSNTDISTSSSSSTPVGAIAGGVVGAVAVLFALLGLLWCRKRRRSPAASPEVLAAPFMTGPMGSVSVISTSAHGHLSPSQLYHEQQQQYHQPQGTYYPSAADASTNPFDSAQLYNTTATSPTAAPGGYTYTYPDTMILSPSSHGHSPSRDSVSGLSSSGSASASGSSSPPLTRRVVMAAGLGKAAALEPRRPVIVQQHQDSGLRMHGRAGIGAGRGELGLQLVELPPGYVP